MKIQIEAVAVLAQPVRFKKNPPFGGFFLKRQPHNKAI